MKKLIAYYYQKEVIDLQGIQPNITLIKAKDGQYILKKTKDTKIEWVAHYIQSLHLDIFVQVLMTIENHYFFSVKEDIYYLMPCLNFESEMVEELKLRNYFKQISKLHNETFFVSKIQEGYFAKEIETMRMKLNTCERFYEDLMQASEKCNYKAPWHWQMLSLYSKIKPCFLMCEEYIQKYECAVKEKKTCRLCFTYNHYDLNHYSLTSNQLISLEGCQFNRPTSDIYAIYHQLQDHYLDFENVESFYFSHFTLYDDEKLWLAVHILMIPIFERQQDPFYMCWSLERVTRYLEMSEKVFKRLGTS